MALKPQCINRRKAVFSRHDRRPKQSIGARGHGVPEPGSRPRVEGLRAQSQLVPDIGQAREQLGSVHGLRAVGGGRPIVAKERSAKDLRFWSSEVRQFDPSPSLVDTRNLGLNPYDIRELGLIGLFERRFH